ncbi:MAG: pseudoazurin [Lautropia sp.]|nr:pseudoazurin [Lautropia sp.]
MIAIQPFARHRLTASALLTFALLTTAPAAPAETFQVKMLNRNSVGAMVYEPDFLKLQPGDTVKFLPSANGHDAATIEGMIPSGATPFTGKINEPIAITFTQPGLYGVKCLPHYAMGMVMLIQVGDSSKPADLVIPESVPARARQRFADIVRRSQQIP